MVAKQPANFTSSMVVVYDELAVCAANDALLNAVFELKQLRISYDRPEFTSVYSVPIRGPTRPAPAIKPISLFIMQRKILSIRRFLDFAFSANQHFHAFLAKRNRLLGFFAAFGHIFIWPAERAQKLSLRGPPSGCGLFKPGFPGLAAL